MKVTGPGSGLPPGEPGGAEGTPGAAGSSPADKPFAEALDPTAAAGGAVDPGTATATATARAGTPPVADLGAELAAGRLSPEVALDRAIGRILDLQVGPHAPPALRAQVEAALREAVASDPLLVEKMKLLAG